MIKAIALNELKQNDTIIGYTLRDEFGKEMNIKSEAIIGAMKENKISISNLNITNDDKLVMVKDNNLDTGKVVEKPANSLDNSSNVKTDSVKMQSVENNSTDKLSRMKYVVSVLDNANRKYEQEDTEVMSNFEYDKLYNELLELEKETGTVLNNSPTQQAGYDIVSKLPKETHEHKMLSLDKTKDRQALLDWLDGKEGVLSWKLDGLTVVVTYENGKLVKAVTRGNGEIGELVTPNAKQFKNLPRHIAFDGKLVIRGEAIISYSDFNKINESMGVDDVKFKNARNLCSGSVRQLDSSVTASRNVNWIAFSLEYVDGTKTIKELDKQLSWLKMQGFDCVDYEVVNPSTLFDVMDRFKGKIESHDKPTDGLVLAYRDRDYGLSLGNTNKFARHSMAFKWKDETAVTELVDIEWSPSKTGLLNPVAIFNPVDIEGSTIARASVHNVSILSELALGYGDRIEVYKANMIIPQISENLDRTGTCEVPSVCPVCGAETVIYEEESSGVLTLYCPNHDCPAKGDRLMEHFVSRDAMNIDGISTATLVAFGEANIITDFASIFHLSDHRDEIVNMEGFGVKSYRNMIDAIEKARDVKLCNLIYALGIPNVGLSTAKLICKHFKNDFKNTVCASYYDLVQIEGIGDTIARSFYNYFNTKETAEQFIDLVGEVNLIEEEISTNGEMAGVTVCVTGDVYEFSSRRVIKDVVENLGGKLTGSVSKSTSYLVTNDTTSGSNKNKAAQQYGIPILTEHEFIEKFNLQNYVK